MTVTPGVAQAAVWSLIHLRGIVGAGSAPAPVPVQPGGATPTTSPGAATQTGLELPAILYSAMLAGVLILALIVLFMPDRNREQRGRIRVMGVAGSGLALFFAIWAVQTQANNAELGSGGRPGGELTEDHAWIVSHTVTAHYHLDADGVALALLLLSTVVFFCAALAAFRHDRRTRVSTAGLLFLEVAVNGVLVANDWLLFLMFWGFLFVPLLLLAPRPGGDGGPRSTRFAITGLLSTALVTLGAMLMVFQGGGGSFEMARTEVTLPGPVATAVFWLFTTGFLLVAGVIPLHRPLLESQDEGGAGLAAVTAAVLPALGAFGMLRVVMAQMPAELAHWSVVIAGLGVIAALWGGLAALSTDRLRRLVGHLGTAQMGAVLVAIAVSNTVAVTGAALMLVSRGLIVALLMFTAVAVEERTRGAALGEVGGLAWQAPRLAAAWVLGGLTAAGAPLLSGFAASLLLFTGAFPGHRISTVLVIAGVALTAFAALRAGQRAFFGGAREALSRVRDLSVLELTYAGVIIALIVILGVFPNRFLGLVSNGASALRGGG